MIESPPSQWPFGAGEMSVRIRGFEWSRTPLGPIHTWTERCRSVVDTVLANGFPAVVLIGPDLIQVYNDGYRVLMGEKHPAGLGQPTRDCWPEVWHINEPIYERVRAGEIVTLEDALYPLARQGTVEDAWLTISYSPLRDGDGAVSDILVTMFETTERVRSQNVQRESEKRFRAFVTTSADVVYRASPDWKEMRQLNGRGFLADPSESNAIWLETYIHADDQPRVLRAVERSVRDGSMFELEHRVRRADGSFGWTLSRAVPILNDRGGITEWLGTAKDVTARRDTEDALRTSEELFRSFAENSTDTLWILDVATDRLDYLSPAFATMFGTDPEHVIADLRRFAELVHPDDRSLVAQAIPKVLSGGETYQVEYRIVRPSDGAVRWIQDTGFPIRAADGRVARIGGVAQDVTDRREADDTLRDSEAQLQVLVAELHHRTRNLIGVVGMIARQLIASSPSLAEFRLRFTERLDALSRVQALFSRRRNEAITVGDIVRIELDALGADLTDRKVRIEGGSVALRKFAVQTLSLAIHELATNARKYGALNADGGELLVRWHDYVADTGRRSLRLTWIETGIVPKGEEADSRSRNGGYGRKLIEEALPYTLKARTTYVLGRDRLDCTIDLPLDG